MDSNYSPPPMSFLPSPTLSIPCPSPTRPSMTSCGGALFTSKFVLSPSATNNSNWNNGGTAVDSYENEPPTQVLPYLYVGNARDANNPELLRKLGISHVLSVTNTKPSPYNRNSSTDSDESSMATNENSNGTRTTVPVPEFRYKLIPVSDNLYENLAPYFEEACDFIEEARKSDTRVLIHCHAGISRSPTFAIAYIMKHINMTMLNAYSFVQLRRRIISPNLNFMGQLVEYESKLKGYATSSSSESSCASSTSSSCDSRSISCYSSIGENSSSGSVSIDEDVDLTSHGHGEDDVIVLDQLNNVMTPSSKDTVSNLMVTDD